ncbi:MAG: serine/threonine phosphatase [Pegethrix bostrychoides GSE-TBD4-15B]|jgi:protein phosphatase|uniref:Serine/threonine phosphatase n=1 Tax=Pegethrix bostrychoides GSE-TBD4-15B TaxID=2839662 RepID=A0A951U6N9_9CYAN|nr:serine/threonine phosphatase [Pegethrix bostrychoides GSE-TBD4-15B]
MLACPDCQFENPDTHKFCQRCGASLTEKICEFCGALVSFDAEYCLQCGAVTGTTWKAILSVAAEEVAAEEMHPSAPALESPESAPIASNLPSLPELPDLAEAAPVKLPAGKFLDVQARYQILDPMPQQIGQSAEVEVRVLDHQPLQPSRVMMNSGEALLPPVAAPYVALQEQFPLLPLPYLQDAWQQQDLQVILLEDRSHLPLLVDLWPDEVMEPLQILHWLHQMAELWAALETQDCCRSLLDLSNLLVDEDHLICLQRLYLDSARQPASLAQLGALWQQLCESSQRTQNAEIFQLAVDLESGRIDSLDSLRNRVEAVAFALQQPATLRSTPEVRQEITQDLRAETHQDAALDQDDEGSDDLPTVVLGMQLVSLEDAGQTDIGRQRSHNEDCFSLQIDLKKQETPRGRVLQAKGLYILCDGMGGHAGGEVASALAVETLQQYFAEHWQDKLPSEELIRDAIQQANRAIFDQNQTNASAGSGRMGTTLVLLMVQDAEAVIAHVGDSRLYRISRRRGLQQLTTDHEVGQREIQRGVEPAIAYARPDAYQLTQALGPRDENFLSPDVKFLELNEDGVLLLCSDGLSDNDLLEIHWQSHLEPMLNASTNLEQSVRQLIDLANQYNGHDNITAIAVRLKVRPNLDQMPR